MGDLNSWNALSDIRLTIYYFSEVGTGMSAKPAHDHRRSGPVGLANWGRRLALGVAWLKIVRWVAIMVVSPETHSAHHDGEDEQGIHQDGCAIQSRPGVAAPPFRMADLARIGSGLGAVLRSSAPWSLRSTRRSPCGSSPAARPCGVSAADGGSGGIPSRGTRWQWS